MEHVNDRFSSHHPHMESVHPRSHPPPRLFMAWEKERVLGKGSYGVVYLGVPIIPTLPYLAIKSTRLQDASSLQKEYRILRNLSHSSQILSSFGIEISADNTVGLVCNLFLEYAPGGTLRDLIRSRGGSLPEAEVKHHTRALVKGLCTIHAKGYVHCDLKPSNILVFPSHRGMNDVKIADFGLTKEPQDQLFFGIVISLGSEGTPVYMSPESVAEGEIEAPLDIWSLGCVVIEMFTGKQAMRCSNLESLMHQLAILKATPGIPDNMSSEGKDFLMKCFATNPKERWTARMLLNHPYILDEVTVTWPPLITEVLLPTVTEPQLTTTELLTEPSAEKTPLDSLPPPTWLDFSFLD